MTEEPPRKRPGRPPKPEAEKKEGNLTFRTRRALREQLAAAAAQSGRSLAEEVERRVEESFSKTTEDVIRAAAEAAASAAAAASEHQLEELIEEMFGGQAGLFVASQFSELFRSALADVQTKHGDMGKIVRDPAVRQSSREDAERGGLGIPDIFRPAIESVQAGIPNVFGDFLKLIAFSVQLTDASGVIESLPQEHRSRVSGAMMEAIIPGLTDAARRIKGRKSDKSDD